MKCQAVALFLLLTMQCLLAFKTTMTSRMIKKEQKIQQATIKKLKKQEWYPIKRTKRSQQDILYYYLLLSTIHTYLIFVNRGALPCKSTPKIAKIGRHRPKFCVFCAKKRALTWKNTPPPVVAVLTNMTYVYTTWWTTNNQTLY